MGNSSSYRKMLMQRGKQAIWRWIIALTVAGSSALCAMAEEVPPDVLVRKTTEDVLTVVRNDKEIRAGNVSKISQLIEEKVAPHFDFERMTRLAVGRPWREASPAQREALIKEFRTLLVGGVSRAQGDVHPGGNPHYLLDPGNAGVVAASVFKRAKAASTPGTICPTSSGFTR